MLRLQWTLDYGPGTMAVVERGANVSRNYRKIVAIVEISKKGRSLSTIHGP